LTQGKEPLHSLNLQSRDVDVPHAFTTQRLLLRMVSTEDAEGIYAACLSQPEVTRYLTWKRHVQPGETASMIGEMLHQWEIGKAAHWSLVPRDGTASMGIVSLRLELYANLSYFLAPEFWGRGYMPEGVGAVVLWALHQEEIDRVWAFADVENISSHRVLEKCGFLSQGVMPHYAVFPNLSPVLRDCVRYALTR
jgi:[ribosomal protein S5]-alanine N-acetyltransferase